MAFWDVGSTSKLVGAPISGDQSALTDMQTWLDKEAKRKRDEAEELRKRKIQEQIGAENKATLDKSFEIRDQARINRNLAIARMAKQSLAPDEEMEIRANPNGAVDPLTGILYKTGEAEMQLGARKAKREARSKQFDAENPDALANADATISAESASAKAQLDSMVSDGSITREYADQIVKASDEKQRSDLLKLVNASQAEKLAASLGRMHDALGIKRSLGKGDAASQYARLREFRRGMALDQATEEDDLQREKLRGIDFGSVDTLDEQQRALTTGLANIAALDPDLKIADSPIERQIKALGEERLKYNLKDLDRVRNQDTLSTQRVNRASTSADAAARMSDAIGKNLKDFDNKLAVQGLKNRGALDVERLRQKANLYIQKLKNIQRQSSDVAANVRSANSASALIRANDPQSQLAQVMEEMMRQDPEMYKASGFQQLAEQSFQDFSHDLGGVSVTGSYENRTPPAEEDDRGWFDRTFGFGKSPEKPKTQYEMKIERDAPSQSSQIGPKKAKKSGAKDSSALPFASLSKDGSTITPKTKAQVDALKAQGYK